MRVLLLADRSFASRERAMIGRVAVGLAGEGFRVVRAAPDIPGDEESGALVRRLTWDDRPGPFAGRMRTQKLLDALDWLELPAPDPESADQPIDLVHAFGEGSWSLAASVAERTGASLAIEAWSAESIARAQRFATHEGRNAPSLRERTLWLAPDRKAFAALEATMPSAVRWLAPWGVHTHSGEPAAFSRPDESLGAVIVGSGKDHGACQAALTALARVAPAFPQLMIFIDEAFVASHHSLWRLAESGGLLPRLSVVDNLEGRREPALGADLLLQPESRGERRTITLDAMGAGMAVLARADDALECLIDGETASLVHADSPGAWETALRKTLSDVEGARSLGRSARAWIQRERLASAHVRAVVNAHQWLLDQEARTSKPAGRIAPKA